MKFTEEKLELAIIQLLTEQGYPHATGDTLVRTSGDEVLIKSDLREYLATTYAKDNVTADEIDSIIKQLETLPASDLYESNKTFCKWLSDGFLLKREAVAGQPSKKDLYIQLIDYEAVQTTFQQSFQGDSTAIAEVNPDYLNQQDNNIYKIVNQLEIDSLNPDYPKRIPDGIIYINGLPVVVFEFKSAIREEQASIHDAFKQLTVRYKRDIPQLFVYNTLCVISDGVNNKMGTVFAKYDFYYAWRKISGNEPLAEEGINSLQSMLQGLFDKSRLCDVLRNFIYFPDKSKDELKITCRYPQYYAARKLFDNIKRHRKLPAGTVGADDDKRDGKGGTYFGATGCGKSFTMQFLARLLMKSVEFESPTIVLITDRTDLDDQLANQFANAKTYIGDDHIVSVESRGQLRQLLKGRNSGGVFLTTIHKFTEDTQLLTERSNVIVISDEAHRSQINLDQKLRITDKGVQKTYGFAKYLHDSLPNATYVGFTGTPIDATLDVFGQVVDSYTMTESVKDEITVRIVYEGRAAKVVLNNAKLDEIEAYYKQCQEAGSNEQQIEQSKKATTNMNSILGDPDRLRVLAADFVNHYETRIAEGTTICGKAMFVCSSRDIAYALYQEIQLLRPDWFEVKESAHAATLRDDEKALAIKAGKLGKPIEKVKLVITRGKDDPKAMYDLLGTKEHRKDLDRQFKIEHSNFKIAIVVDMWLTGFDVPFLDTIYIDKPLQKHNLIQTISRVNRKFAGKHKGLVVDYIGIKSAMNKALAQFNKTDEGNFEDINQSVIAVKDHLALLADVFHGFDSTGYFTGEPLAQLNCLNQASEFILEKGQREKRFSALLKRLKAAYDICCGSEKLSQAELDKIHFYLAVRSIIYKLTKGEAPDSAQMNAKVREMIAEALKSEGVEEILKMDDSQGEIDIFDEDYLNKIDKIKLPNTKIMMLQKLLNKAIGDMKKVNLAQGIDFSQRFKALVDKYNERKEDDVLVSGVLEDFSDELIKMMGDLREEFGAHDDLDISFEEKAFYDILKRLAAKYDFSYPDEQLLELAKAVKAVVDDKAKYTDWSQRDDIKAELKVDLIILLAKFKYPPVSRDEVYQEIFSQAENFKKNRAWRQK